MKDPTLSPILDRIRAAAGRAGRPPASVRLIAVSKGQPLEKILRLAEAGVRDFGENYVQEWKPKAQALEKFHPGLASEIRWHFIGHLQSNKARELVEKVDFIQSVDSLKLAKIISSLAEKSQGPQQVCLEVNLAGEADKSGFSPADLLRELPLLAELSYLRLAGLMAVPPALPDPVQVRPYFAKLKSLLDECNGSGLLKQPLTELSMGMSQDFEVAIEEGATMVRIGTALFGPRQ